MLQMFVIIYHIFRREQQQQYWCFGGFGFVREQNFLGVLVQLVTSSKYEWPEDELEMSQGASGVFKGKGQYILSE